MAWLKRNLLGHIRGVVRNKENPIQYRTMTSDHGLRYSMRQQAIIVNLGLMYFQNEVSVQSVVNELFWMQKHWKEMYSKFCLTGVCARQRFYYTCTNRSRLKDIISIQAPRLFTLCFDDILVPLWKLQHVVNFSPVRTLWM